MYKDLSLKEKSELFKLMVSNGITDINEIEKIYNSYSDGGYLSYMEKLAKKKAKDWGMEEDEALTMMLNNNEYDYKAFYNNNREDALKMLNSDSNTHFSDIGKTVWHPTFSNESIYSGKVSEYNPKGTIGGSWKGLEYVPSKSQLDNKDFNYNRTKKYLDNTPEYISDTYNKYQYGSAINKFDGTSTKTQQMQTVEKPAFFEGDTWKPQYWFSPEYENATLKGAITQAYEDGNYGKDIIWNGRAYKAILNEEDANEYRKKKGITLGEPIVNTANIQTNEKQPREYVSNSYIPVTSGNKIYYWDSYSGKFFEDAKGKTPTSKDYNTLLKDYYDQNISPALKENRYEDLIKLYVQQFRNLQARRRVSAREQDIPNDYGKRTITITTGRSGSSILPYPTDLIDSLSNHLQEGQSIYQALALPYKETEFGNRVNFESDVMGNRGHVLATLNDERYELPDQTFYSGLSYPLRSYFRNNKVDGKVDGMTQENFVKHYLASSENDLLDLKNLFNNKELLKYVGETLKKDLTKSRFVSFMNTNTEDNPNIYEHALSLLASGKYNPGEPGYNKGINKIAKQLENDPELNNYIDKHKIKKVGEKKK